MQNVVHSNANSLQRYGVVQYNTKDWKLQNSNISLLDSLTQDFAKFGPLDISGSQISLFSSINGTIFEVMGFVIQKYT